MYRSIIREKRENSRRTSTSALLNIRVKKQQLESDMEQQTGSKLGKEYVKAVYCHPAYLTSINNLRYTNDTTLMAESEEELKSILMK